jgi:hypothetical protein
VVKCCKFKTGGCIGKVGGALNIPQVDMTFNTIEVRSESFEHSVDRWVPTVTFPPGSNHWLAVAPKPDVCPVLNSGENVSSKKVNTHCFGPLYVPVGVSAVPPFSELPCAPLPTDEDADPNG